MELEIAVRSCQDQLGRTRTFHYFLTVDLEQSQRFCLENYGASVSEENGDKSSVPALTTSASRIDELMTLLVDHLVGPAGLKDVVQDWL